jgi:hypothetical protein
MIVMIAAIGYVAGNCGLPEVSEHFRKKTAGTKISFQVIF